MKGLLKSYHEASSKLILGVHPRVLYKKFKLALIVTVLVCAITSAIAVLILTPLIDFIAKDSPMGLTIRDFIGSLRSIIYSLPPPAQVLVFLTSPLASLIFLFYTLMPIFKLKSHYSGVQEESVWAIFASTVYAMAGVPPLRIFGILGEKDYILSRISKEVKRIERDSKIKMKSLLDVLRDEYKDAKKFWRLLLGTIISLETTGGDILTYFRDLYRTTVRELRVAFENQAKTMGTLSAVTVIFLAILLMSVYVMLTMNPHYISCYLNEKENN